MYRKKKRRNDGQQTIRKYLPGLALSTILVPVLIVVNLGQMFWPIHSSSPCLQEERTVSTSEARRVPKQIFIFWAQGFEHPSAEKYARWAKRTWELINPDYEIRALNSLEEAANLANQSLYIPGAIWDNCTIQAKSDILRTLLLYQHGGVWVDASVFCAVPLSSWLEDQPDLYSNLRIDEESKELRRDGLDPWITSWFLVTPPGSYMISRIFEAMVAPDGMGDRFQKEYFWWHRLVATVAQSDERVMRRITRFPSAKGSHCSSKDYWKTTPFFKRCAIDRFKQLIPLFEHCCLGDRLNISDSNCGDFDCSTLSPNFKLNVTEHPSTFFIG